MTSDSLPLQPGAVALRVTLYVADPYQTVVGRLGQLVREYGGQIGRVCREDLSPDLLQLGLPAKIVAALGRLGVYERCQLERYTEADLTSGLTWPDYRTLVHTLHQPKDNSGSLSLAGAPIFESSLESLKLDAKTYRNLRQATVKIGSLLSLRFRLIEDLKGYDYIALAEFVGWSNAPAFWSELQRRELPLTPPYATRTLKDLFPGSSMRNKLASCGLLDVLLAELTYEQLTQIMDGPAPRHDRSLAATEALRLRNLANRILQRLRQVGGPDLGENF